MGTRAYMILNVYKIIFVRVVKLMPNSLVKQMYSILFFADDCVCAIFTINLILGKLFPYFLSGGVYSCLLSIFNNS